MFRKVNPLMGLLVAVVLFGSPLSGVLADEALDNAFKTLKTYDWGHDRTALQAIDQAVAATRGNADARKALETRLVAVLKGDAPRAAKDFACRKLSLVGSPAAVPALVPLLADKDLSHMARYALERMSCPESVAAMRDALPKVNGRVKVGVINSLGVRRDSKSVAALVALLGDSDQEIVAAAAAALGSVGTPEAAKALQGVLAKAPKELGLAAADAYLTCAECLLADGKKVDSLLIYKALSKSDQPKHVQLAAKRGLLAAMKKK